MKFDKEWLKQNWVAYSVALCIGILFYVIISNIGNVWGAIKKIYSFITPVIGGAIIAYLLNPLINSNFVSLQSPEILKYLYILSTFLEESVVGKLWTRNAITNCCIFE